VKRVLVHESVYGEFKEKAVEKVSRFTVGDGMGDPDIGPLISEKQLTLLEGQVNDSVRAGARVLVGGKRLARKGFFFEPTVMENAEATRVMREEVFGPVMPLSSFKGVEEAVAKANDTEYGLGASVWGREKAEEVARALDTGMVWVNCGKAAHPQLPWVGRKNSGIGHEHGKYGVLDLVQLKPIIRG
jgi:acyl-CoA reductase-like NAD-dependent aldehyde dehydrogenase